MVDNSKFTLLILLVAALFLGIGFFAAKITSPHINTETFQLTDSAQETPQSLLQKVLQNKQMTDPQGVYGKQFNTSLFYTHSITGKILSFNRTAISIYAQNSSFTLPLTSDVVFLETANSSRIGTSSSVLRIGRVANIMNLIEAETYTYAGTVITVSG